MGGPHRCRSTGNTFTRHAEEVGIHIDKWTVDPQHRSAQFAGISWRVCHRPRTGPSPCPKSREGVQKFHVRLPPRLGRKAASLTGLAGGLEMDFHPSTLRFTYLGLTQLDDEVLQFDVSSPMRGILPRLPPSVPPQAGGRTLSVDRRQS